MNFFLTNQKKNKPSSKHRKRYTHHIDKQICWQFTTPQIKEIFRLLSYFLFRIIFTQLFIHILITFKALNLNGLEDDHDLKMKMPLLIIMMSNMVIYSEDNDNKKAFCYIWESDYYIISIHSKWWLRNLRFEFKS